MHPGLGARITAILPAHWLAQALPLLCILDKISVQCKTGREEAEQSENKQESFIVQLKPHAQTRQGRERIGCREHRGEEQRP